MTSLLALLLALFGATLAWPPPGSAVVPAPSRGVATSATVSPRYVVAITVDGLATSTMRDLGRAGLPNLYRMIDEGASTLNARTAYESTVTLPNHAGIFTGRRVGGRAGHQVTMDRDPGGTIAGLAGRYRASFFDVVHNRGGRTALFASKDKFALFDRSWNARNGAPDRVGVDNGRDKIDRYVYDDSGALVNRVVRRLADKPFQTTFLHIALPDLTGHQYGYLGPEYRDAVQQSDRLVGKVLDAAARRGSVAVLLTADHGGSPPGHSRPDVRGNYTVPFLAWGAGVQPGADLYALNPARTDPGTSRPTYRDPPPIRNLDMASLVTTLLGYPPVPGGVLRGTEPLRVTASP